MSHPGHKMFGLEVPLLQLYSFLIRTFPCGLKGPFSENAPTPTEEQPGPTPKKHTNFFIRKNQKKVSHLYNSDCEKGILVRSIIMSFFRGGEEARDIQTSIQPKN